jgi:hypothetical protein
LLVPNANSGHVLGLIPRPADGIVIGSEGSPCKVCRLLRLPGFDFVHGVSDNNACEQEKGGVCVSTLDGLAPFASAPRSEAGGRAAAYRRRPMGRFRTASPETGGPAFGGLNNDRNYMRVAIGEPPAPHKKVLRGSRTAREKLGETGRLNSEPTCYINKLGNRRAPLTFAHTISGAGRQRTTLRSAVFHRRRNSPGRRGSSLWRCSGSNRPDSRRRSDRRRRSDH